VPSNAVLRMPLELRYASGFALRALWLPQPFDLLGGLLAARRVPLRERLDAVRFVLAMRRRRFRLHEDCSVEDLLARHRQGGTIGKHLWRPLCVSALNTPPAQASAAVFLAVLRDTLAGPPGASDLLLPRVDLSRLFPEPAAAFVAAAFYVQIAAQGTIATGSWFISVLLAYILLWVLGVVLATVFLPGMKDQVRQLVSRNQAKWHAAFVAFATLAGATGAALLLGIAKTIGAVPEAHRLWIGMTFGPPAVISAIMLMVVAHVGFMGRKFSEADRELWSVFGARLLTLVLCWITLFGIALYGSAAIRWANDWIVGLGGVAWLMSTLFGIFAGKSRATGKQKANRSVELLTRVGPYAFVLGCC